MYLCRCEARMAESAPFDWLTPCIRTWMCHATQSKRACALLPCEEHTHAVTVIALYLCNSIRCQSKPSVF